VLTAHVTPIEPAPILARLLGVDGGPPLLVKREDLTHPVHGGNKVRALAPILEHARDRGARRLVSFGPRGSNHVLALAIHGRALGFEVEAFLVPRVPSPRAASVALATLATGTILRCVGSLEVAARYVLEALSAGSGFVPPGGGSRLGASGCVAAGREAGAQLDALGLGPVRHVLPWGTGTTATGIAWGLGLAGRTDDEVAAVQVVSSAAANPLVSALAYLRARPVGASRSAHLRRIVLDHDPGYGRPCAASLRAAAALEHAGLPWDETYSAKAAAFVAGAGAFQAAGRPTLLWITTARAPAPIADATRRALLAEADGRLSAWISLGFERDPRYLAMR
jgi:D-cysteine desulfhydrase